MESEAGRIQPTAPVKVKKDAQRKNVHQFRKWKTDLFKLRRLISRAIFVSLLQPFMMRISYGRCPLTQYQVLPTFSRWLAVGISLQLLLPGSAFTAADASPELAIAAKRPSLLPSSSKCSQKFSSSLNEVSSSSVSHREGGQVQRDTKLLVNLNNRCDEITLAIEKGEVTTGDQLLLRLGGVERSWKRLGFVSTPPAFLRMIRVATLREMRVLDGMTEREISVLDWAVGVLYFAGKYREMVNLFDKDGELLSKQVSPVRLLMLSLAARQIGRSYLCEKIRDIYYHQGMRVFEDIFLSDLWNRTTNAKEVLSELQWLGGKHDISAQYYLLYLVGGQVGSFRGKNVQSEMFGSLESIRHDGTVPVIAPGHAVLIPSPEARLRASRLAKVKTPATSAPARVLQGVDVLSNSSSSDFKKLLFCATGGMAKGNRCAEYLESLVAHGNPAPLVFVLLGARYKREGRLEDASNAYQRALDIISRAELGAPVRRDQQWYSTACNNSIKSAVLSNKVSVDILQLHWSTAMDEINQLIRLMEPQQCAEIYKKRALVFLIGFGDRASAQKDMYRARGNDPNSARARSLEALQLLTSANSPDEWYLRQRIGILKILGEGEANNDPKSARERFLEALKLMAVSRQTDDQAALTQRVGALWCLGNVEANQLNDPKSARERFLEALKLITGSSRTDDWADDWASNLRTETLFHLGVLEVRLNNTKSGRERFLEVLKLLGDCNRDTNRNTNDSVGFERRVETLCTLAAVEAFNLSDPTAGRQRLLEALRLLAGFPTTREWVFTQRTGALILLANIEANKLNDPQSGRQRLLEALALLARSRRTDDWGITQRVEALTCLGNMETSKLNDPKSGKQRLLEAVALLASTGRTDDWSITQRVEALTRLGNMEANKLNDPKSARKRFLETLKVLADSKRTDDLVFRREVETLYSLGNMECTLHDVNSGKKRLLEELKLLEDSRRTDEWTFQQKVQALCILGTVEANKLNDAKTGREHLLEAFKLLTDLNKFDQIAADKENAVQTRVGYSVVLAGIEADKLNDAKSGRARLLEVLKFLDDSRRSDDWATVVRILALKSLGDMEANKLNDVKRGKERLLDALKLLSDFKKPDDWALKPQKIEVLEILGDIEANKLNDRRSGRARILEALKLLCDLSKPDEESRKLELRGQKILGEIDRIKNSGPLRPLQ